MRRVASLLVIGLGAVSFLWSVMVVSVEYIRLEYRPVIAAIQSDAPPDMETVKQSIATYENALRFLPCTQSVYKDLLLLYAYAADASLLQSIEGFSSYLEKTSHTLEMQLSCSPHDGKAWLDYAVIAMHREGFSDSVVKLYKMSARVAPQEAWLAEKRLLFALPLLALLDREALQITKNDVTVMQQALAKRQLDFMAVTGLESWEKITAMIESALHAQR